MAGKLKMFEDRLRGVLVVKPQNVGFTHPHSCNLFANSSTFVDFQLIHCITIALVFTISGAYRSLDMNKDPRLNFYNFHFICQPYIRITNLDATSTNPYPTLGRVEIACAMY